MPYRSFVLMGLFLSLCLGLNQQYALADTPESANAPDWVNALEPSGDPGPKLRLAGKGEAHYAILLAAAPTTMEEKAAEDLARWLEEMTNASFPIVREDVDMATDQSFISIGNTALRKQQIPQEAIPDLKEEGYGIFVEGKNLFLIGGDTRGVINAVYALLEEDLGCRWYERDSGGDIPGRPDLRFRPMQRSYVPTLRIRDPYYWHAFDGDWSLRNRTNSPAASVPEAHGGHVDYALFVHTFNHLMPPDSYFDDHPEYYSELDGERKPRQLCMTHPEVREIVLERCKNILREKPDCEIISISPNDWTDYCTCADCKAIDEAEGSQSASLLTFVNAIAAGLEEEFPDVEVSTLAYLGTFMPPKTITPRHNVAIRLCTDSHAWPHPFLTITETTDFQEAMKAWHDMGARIHIWDYTVNFSHHIAPMPNMPVVDAAIPFFIEHGAEGVMLQGFYECAGTENAAMRNWVWAKYLWDPSLDTQTLMQDFILGYFREAAAPIWQYNRLLWEMWEEERSKPREEDRLYDLDIRYRPDSDFLSDEFLETGFALFEKAEALAETDETTRRVAVAKLPLLYVKLSQGLGFLGDWNGDPVPGDMEPGEVEEYADLFAEFEAIAYAENITTFQEGMGDAERRIQYWRDELARLRNE